MTPLYDLAKTDSKSFLIGTWRRFLRATRRIRAIWVTVTWLSKRLKSLRPKTRWHRSSGSDTSGKTTSKLRLTSRKYHSADRSHFLGKHFDALYTNWWLASLFVFQRDDPQQNGLKPVSPVSNLIFNALSDDGTIHFALHGSSLNHNLIGWNNSNSQSESFVLMVLKAAIGRKKKGTIWKSNENWVRKWCQKWHTILFTATTGFF